MHAPCISARPLLRHFPPPPWSSPGSPCPSGRGKARVRAPPVRLIFLIHIGTFLFPCCRSVWGGYSGHTALAPALTVKKKTHSSRYSKYIVLLTILSCSFLQFMLNGTVPYLYLIWHTVIWYLKPYLVFYVIADAAGSISGTLAAVQIRQTLTSSQQW